MSDDRLEALKAKLKSRRGKPEYARNVEELEAEIARLEAESKES